MRCLTIRQPYAWAIMHGGKNIENRSTAWRYRGSLAIHAGTRFSSQGVDEVSSVLGYCVTEGATPGVILGVVDLVDVHRELVGCCAPWGHAGAVHLVLAHPRRLPVPIPCRGQLGLWTLPADVVAAIEGAAS